MIRALLRLFRKPRRPDLTSRRREQLADSYRVKCRRHEPRAHVWRDLRDATCDQLKLERTR